MSIAAAARNLLAAIVATDDGEPATWTITATGRTVQVRTLTRARGMLPQVADGGQRDGSEIEATIDISAAPGAGPSDVVRFPPGSPWAGDWGCAQVLSADRACLVLLLRRNPRQDSRGPNARRLP